ncbi:MAG: NAD(P)H-dependent oxidoreductase [Anaerolineae bacterium]
MPDNPIKVVAICGSLNPKSKTRLALQTALRGAAEKGAETQLIDLLDYDLVFANGRDDYPGCVHHLREDVRQAHGIILGTPEYHGGYSGVLKNALDLMGFKEFQGKIVGLLGVAGGATGAINSLNGLRTVCRNLRAWVVPNQVSIAQAWKEFDDSGRLKDSQLEARVLELGQEVARFAYLHHSDAAKEFLRTWEEAPENPGGDQ